MLQLTLMGNGSLSIRTLHCQFADNNTWDTIKCHFSSQLCSMAVSLFPYNLFLPWTTTDVCHITAANSVQHTGFPTHRWFMHTSDSTAECSHERPFNGEKDATYTAENNGEKHAGLFLSKCCKRTSWKYYHAQSSVSCTTSNIYSKMSSSEALELRVTITWIKSAKIIALLQYNC